MTKQCVVVTGGAGYIGAHACKALYKNGFLPVVFDNLSFGHKSSVKWGPLVVGDLQNTQKLNELFKTYKPIGVMHFAANALVAESTVNPLKYYQNNVAGTLSLLQAMLEQQIPYLIFSSSCATYGNPISVPISEDHPQNPINPYGRSKLMIEQILQDFSVAFNLRYAALRYFNAAGADFDGEIGEDHTPETHLIPLVMQTALNLREKIDVFGTDFETKDGTAIRDYIHVDDLIDAHLKALFFLMEKKNNILLNLGSERGFSVLEIIQEVENFCNKKLKVVNSPRRVGDPPILIANSTKAQKILGWSPKYTLHDIISSAWKWHSRC